MYPTLDEKRSSSGDMKCQPRTREEQIASSIWLSSYMHGAKRFCPRWHTSLIYTPPECQEYMTRTCISSWLDRRGYCLTSRGLLGDSHTHYFGCNAW
jgi:hypothetical protein